MKLRAMRATLLAGGGAAGLQTQMVSLSRLAEERIYLGASCQAGPSGPVALVLYTSPEIAVDLPGPGFYHVLDSVTLTETFRRLILESRTWGEVMDASEAITLTKIARDLAYQAEEILLGERYLLEPEERNRDRRVIEEIVASEEFQLSRFVYILQEAAEAAGFTEALRRNIEERNQDLTVAETLEVSEVVQVLTTALRLIEQDEGVLLDEAFALTPDERSQDRPLSEELAAFEAALVVATSVHFMDVDEGVLLDETLALTPDERSQDRPLSEEMAASEAVSMTQRSFHLLPSAEVVGLTELYSRSRTPRPPAAPSAVTFTRLTPDPHSDLGWANRVEWNDNSTNESGFNVRRSVNGGSFVTVAGSPAGPNATTHTDPNVVELTNYRYQVQSFYTLGGDTASSAFVNSSTVRTWAMSPSGLSGSAISPTSVQLTWENHSQASHVRIYRGGSLLTTIESTGRTIAQSQSVAALPGRLNEYEVRAYDSATNQESLPNAAQTVVATPAAPPSVSATDVSYCTGGNVGTPRVYLFIAAGADDPAWRLRIRRNLDSPAGWQVVADNLPIGTKEWYDEDGVLLGNGAFYEVEQYRSGYPTSSAQAAKLTNIGQGVCPGHVTGTGASGASICEGNGQVAWASHLTWDARSGWSVRIERARNSSFTSGHGTVGIFGSAVSETWDDGLPSGGLYYYRWRYERTVAGKTSYGPWTSRSVDLVTPCPPSLTGSNYARASITPCPITQEVHCVGWDLIDPAPGYYIRIRRRINGGSWTIVSDQDSGLSNIPLTAATCVPPGTTYGVAVTPLLYGDDGPNNHTDNIQYEITVRDAGGSVYSTSLTANYAQSHSFC